jgi:aspartyl-tRNA(Asn)/glutamyl-tRNA(Gln) amidotransferase subunit A
MVAEMEPIYERYDALVTAGQYGPAPRFGTHQTVAWWKNPQIPTPFNVTGGPAVSVCNGFSQSGLPLSMQVAGRPFDEVTVLRVAHAFEQATSWRERRPVIDSSDGETFEIPSDQPPWGEKNDDPYVRDEVAHRARSIGLSLNEEQFKQVCDAAPFVKARIERLRHVRPREEEPANTFCFPRVSTPNEGE